MSDSLNAEQPAPVLNSESGPGVWSVILAMTPDMDPALMNDIIERNAIGTKKYGQPLCVWNGRDPVVDAYQELLDLYVYLTQAHLRCLHYQGRDDAPDHLEKTAAQIQDLTRQLVPMLSQLRLYAESKLVPVLPPDEPLHTVVYGEHRGWPVKALSELQLTATIRWTREELKKAGQSAGKLQDLSNQMRHIWDEDQRRLAKRDASKGW